MPVYMITLHAYRSWTEDHKKGYYQHGKSGVQTSNPALSIHRSRQANDPPRLFTSDEKQFIIDQLPDIASRRKVRLHAASCTATHVHLVASWFGSEEINQGIKEPQQQARVAAAKVKNILATLLSKRQATTGNRWFSRGFDCTPIEDRKHLNFLLEIYLPKHRHEGGVVQIFDNGNTNP